MFANLSEEDKEAFFALLDEYFESRPHLLAGATTPADAAAPAVAALQTAVKNNPQAAANLMTAGARNLNKWNANQRASDASPSSETPADDKPSPAFGRVAAAAANLASKGATPFGSSPSPSSSPAPPVPRAATRPGGAPPPPPTRRTPSSASQESPTPPRPLNAGLVTTKKMGDVNTSSVGAAFGSLMPKKAPPPPPPAPAALPASRAPRSSFAPPPTRAAPVTRAPTPPPEPEEEPEPEPEEWVKALYDHQGEDSGDLPFQEGARIKVIEHNSPDWWTGELNGRQGLFPSSYVEIMHV
ncbi:hypothetical protein DL93DRAFT_2086491, partial [Clavulina sp. PMI_390]